MSTMSDFNDLDLEYKDVVHDSTDPANQQLESEIPERYKEKSTEDLIKMHVNLEKVLRRQGSELGQLRKLTDTQSQLLLQTTQGANIRPGQGAPAEPPKPDPVTAESLLSRPDETLSKVISQSPSVTRTNQRMDNLERDLARRDFENKHTSYKEDVNTPEFQEWVLQSPVRSKLLVSLHQNYNFDAGSELWALWDEHNSIRNQAVDSAAKDRAAAARTVRGTSSEAGTGKPTYSRAKLAELQLKAARGDPAAVARWNDPEFQKDYLLAYQENRVK